MRSVACGVCTIILQKIYTKSIIIVIIVIMMVCQGVHGFTFLYNTQSLMQMIMLHNIAYEWCFPIYSYTFINIA